MADTVNITSMKFIYGDEAGLVIQDTTLSELKILLEKILRNFKNIPKLDTIP